MKSKLAYQFGGVPEVSVFATSAVITVCLNKENIF